MDVLKTAVFVVATILMIAVSWALFYVLPIPLWAVLGIAAAFGLDWLSKLLLGPQMTLSSEDRQRVQEYRQSKRLRA